MKYFNAKDFEELNLEDLQLDEQRGEPELAPIGSKGPDSSPLAVRRSDLFFAEGQRAAPAARRTEAAFSFCLRSYENSSLEEGTGLTDRWRGCVHAVPRLVWENEVSLELTVGEGRQYVVRNLEEFCGSLREGEALSFGKQFTMPGSVECFHETSRGLIYFILERYDHVRALDRLGSGYPYNAATDKLFTKGKRGMCLTQSSLDEFCRLWLNQSIVVNRKELWTHSRLTASFGSHPKDPHQEKCGLSQILQGFEKRMYIREEQPKLSLQVQQEEDGILLQVESLPLVAKGENHLYLCFAGSSDCLWRCDRGYKDSMERFLTALWQCQGQLFIAQADLVRFCASVMPSLDPYVEFLGETECLKNYTPAEMRPKIFLDSPSRDVIAAVVKADYGGTMISLYGPAAEEEPQGLLRNSPREQRMRIQLERWFSELDPRTGILYLKDEDEKLYDFVKGGQQELAKEADIFITDRYRRLLFPQKTKLAARVSLESQLLKVTFDFEGFPVEELLDALSSYRAKRRFHRLADGAFVAFEEQELLDAFVFAEGMQLTREELARGAADIPRYRAMYLDRIMKEAETIHFDRDSHYRRLIREIHGIEDSEIDPPESLAPVLRDYQKTGFCWLATMAKLGFGGVLADDMGLGKTLEMISVLVHQAETWQCSQAEGDPRTLALVVCPASLVLNWEQELRRFAPQLCPVAIMGTAGERKKLIGEIQRAGEERGSRTVAITSYDLLKRDLSLYEETPFLYHILDEAQYIKNFSTQNAKAVKGIDSVHRFALTGTPVENRLSELWSIFDFLMPGFLGSYADFREEYEMSILRDRDQDKTERLRGQIMPFVLRRLKRRVLAELPEKVESVVCVPMEKDQRKIYLSNLAKVKLEIGREIREGGFESHQIQILAMLTRLRQICCHPALCYENYEKESGKLEACIELLKEAVDGGHRVLLFSQFTSMLDILAHRLKQEHIPHYMLTGKTEKPRRQQLVESFNDGNTPVFLISLKAGGTGLNLTGADVVIHYDPWWNQAAQNQATDRAHRIGQKNSVQVYKLVAQNTIEEKIVKLQENKGQLADSIIGENSTLLTMLDEARLEELFSD